MFEFLVLKYSKSLTGPKGTIAVYNNRKKYNVNQVSKQAAISWAIFCASPWCIGLASLRSQSTRQEVFGS